MVRFDLTSKRFEDKGTAKWWLKNNGGKFRTYVRRVAMPHDWDLFEWMIYNNYPVIGKIIIDDYFRDDEEKLKKVISVFKKQNGQVWTIVGKRGSGKTFTAYSLLERIHRETKREVYLAGPPQAMPSFMKRISNMADAPQGSVVFVDEAASKFFARDAMTANSKETLKLLNTLRHTGRNVIFATQTLRSTDLLIREATDVLVVKKQGVLMSSEEKGVVRDIFPLIKPHTLGETLFNFEEWHTMVREMPKAECWREIYSTPYTAITDEATALQMAREYADNQMQAMGYPQPDFVEIRRELSLRSFKRPIDWWKEKLWVEEAEIKTSEEEAPIQERIEEVPVY